MVGNDVLLSVFGSGVAIGEALHTPVLGRREVAGRLCRWKTLGRNNVALVCLNAPFTFALVEADDAAGKELVANPQTWRASALGSVGSHGGGFNFGFGLSAFASKGCGGGCNVGGSGHGLVWLVGALLPADVETIPNRLGYARKSLNYFHASKTHLFSPLNAIAQAPMPAPKDL